MSSFFTSVVRRARSIPFVSFVSKGLHCRACFSIPISTLTSNTKNFDTVHEYAVREGLEIAFAEGYPIEDFLRKTLTMGKDRCSHCYEVRLRYTAEQARKEFFDGFTTTLLYSRYQKHDLIRTTGENIAREFD